MKARLENAIKASENEFFNIHIKLKEITWGLLKCKNFGEKVQDELKNARKGLENAIFKMHIKLMEIIWGFLKMICQIRKKRRYCNFQPVY